jgi:hypothetical protein
MAAPTPGTRPASGTRTRPGSRRLPLGLALPGGGSGPRLGPVARRAESDSALRATGASISPMGHGATTGTSLWPTGTIRVPGPRTGTGENGPVTWWMRLKWRASTARRDLAWQPMHACCQRQPVHPVDNGRPCTLVVSGRPRLWPAAARARLWPAAACARLWPAAGRVRSWSAAARARLWPAAAREPLWSAGRVVRSGGQPMDFAPSRDSLMMSAWPACWAVSVAMCSSVRRADQRAPGSYHGAGGSG